MKNETIKSKKVPVRIKFLLAMVCIYAVFFIADREFTKGVFLDFLFMAGKIIPVLVFTFSITFIVNLYVNPQTIRKHLGSESGLKGWLYAVFGSIIVSGPPFVLYPMFGELKKHGMKDSLIAAFFTNRNVQPAFFPAMVYYFGLPFTIIMSTYILIFAFINGFLTGKIIDHTK